MQIRNGHDVSSRPFAPPEPELFARLRLYTLRFAIAIGTAHDFRSWGWVQRLTSDIRFVNSARERGVISQGTSFVVWFDADGDDRIDLLVRNALYLNREDGFVDVTRDAFPSDSIGTGSIAPTSAATADIDADGDEDIIVADHVHATVRVYEAVGDGSYADATTQSGIVGTFPQGLALADLDGDRDIDIYIANWDDRVGGHRADDPNSLWLNDGSGRFKEAAGTFRVEGLPECPNYPKEQYRHGLVKNAYQPVAFDYDNDGDMDLFVATDTWISPLYRNDGGVFTDVTYEAGLCVPGTGMGIALSDIDQNGFTDIYVTNTGDNYLWMNQGDGTFEEAAKARGIANAGQGWGTHFADFDNDGDDDLYVVNSNQEALSAGDGRVDPRNVDAVYENEGGFFYDITKASGVSGSWAKTASGVADVDADGLPDVLVGGVMLPAGTSDPLYTNVTETEASWMIVRLMGAAPNTSAIGARVTVKTPTQKFVRTITSGTSFHSQDSRWLHFGLGTERRIDEIVIDWHGGTRDVITGVEPDQILSVQESVGVVRREIQ